MKIGDESFQKFMNEPLNITLEQQWMAHGMVLRVISDLTTQTPHS